MMLRSIIRKLICAAILTLAAAAASYGDTSLDNYVTIKRESKALTLQPNEVLGNPNGCLGSIFELRGTMSGIAKSDEKVSIIITNDNGSFVITAEQTPQIPSGSSVCALVKIGEKTTSMALDLRLVAIEYEGRVAAREQAAIEAEKAKLAKEAANKNARAVTASRYGGQTNRAAAAPINMQEMVNAYKKAIKYYNSRLSDKQADTIARSILAFSIKYQIDPRLVVAVILAESHFRPEATSKKGAMGLGQLMPSTAAGLGISNAYDPVENIRGSVRLIKGHLDKLSGGREWNKLTWEHLELALASYNAGSGAVKKYGGVPPYRETQAYINRVISYYKSLCGIKK